MRYLILLLALVGCSANADDKPAGKKLTYTEQVAKFEATVAGMNATIGNNTAELEAVKGELKAIRDLLSVPDVVPVPVPPAEAPRVDAPPVESAGQRVTLNGKPLDVTATIRANYRKRWTHPGSIDSHLAEHGVAGVEGLDNDTKERLHSALHEMGLTPAVAVKKERTVVKAAAPLPLPVSNCPNGNCPLPQYSYQQSRFRMFGGRWR